MFQENQDIMKRLNELKQDSLEMKIAIKPEIKVEKKSRKQN